MKHSFARKHRDLILIVLSFGLSLILGGAFIALYGADPFAAYASMIRGAAFDHPDMVFDWALAHREQVDKLVDASSLSRYYAGLGASSSDPAMVGKIRGYAEKYLAPTSRRDADTAIAGIEYRIKVHKEQIPAVDAWLAKNGG